MQLFEIANETFSEALGVFCDRAKHRRQCSFANLLGQSVQMAQTLWGDFNLIHRGFPYT
jgi:hypothetical protein